MVMLTSMLAPPSKKEGRVIQPSNSTYRLLETIDGCIRGTLHLFSHSTKYMNDVVGLVTTTDYYH